MRACAIAILFAGGCHVTEEFPCTSSTQCRSGDTDGTCEPQGFCSFVDDGCMSGRRFDTTASAALAGQCVAELQGCETWKAHYFQPCRLPSATATLELTAAESPYLFSTDDGLITSGTGAVTEVASAIVDQVGGQARVISVDHFIVDAGVYVHVVGTMPLMVAAWTDIRIEGVLDAGSHGALGGAGSNPAACAATAAGAGGVGMDPPGSGGGGGGGYQGVGGIGGPGLLGPVSAPTPGVAGAIITPVPRTLRGGCAGGGGGTAGASPMVVPPATAASFAAGGGGGGAILLAARTSLSVTGIVIAGGGGGSGAVIGSAGGGGGGGAGGMIAIEAPSIQVTGQLAANGGGGAGGVELAAAGMPGVDALATATQALGGASQCSTQGGKGGAGTILAGGDIAGSSSCGGAGGGGGVGYILVFAPAGFGGPASPAPVVNPF